MAVVVTDRRATLDQADTTTGWTGAGFGTTTTDFAESTAAVAQALNIATGQVYFGTSLNLTNTMVYVYSQNSAIQGVWTTGVHALYLGDGTNNMAFHMAGSDRRVFAHSDGPANWQCLLLDTSQGSTMNSAGRVTAVNGSFGSLNLGSITRVGSHFITLSKALGGGYNVAVDIIRYGNDGIRITGGGSGTEGTFLEVVTEDRSTANLKAHGIIREYTTNLYGAQGPLTFGNSGAATTSYFEDEGIVLVFENRNVSNDKYYFNVEGNSGSTNSFVLIGSTISSAGPHASVNMSGGNVNVLTLDGVSFTALSGSIAFSANADASGHSVTNCIFDGCGQITAGLVDFTNNQIRNSTATSGAVVSGGGDMRNLAVTSYEGTANTSALIYNVAADPDGELDGSSFTKGTAATHAIEFGLSSPTDITLRNVSFTGYNGSNNQNDSTLHIKRTTGTVTINIIGGGTPSYRTDGAIVTIVANPVTTTVTVVDVVTGDPIQNARVYVVADSGGPLSAGTPIIDKVLTDVNGEASDTRTLASNQPITGWVRKGSSAPRYQQGNITGTISSTNGLEVTVQMVPDE